MFIATDIRGRVMGNNYCKTCRHFKRGRWHKAYGGGEQLGGKCKVLCSILKITNTTLFWQDDLYVYESFGCSGYCKKASRKKVNK